MSVGNLNSETIYPQHAVTTKYLIHLMPRPSTGHKIVWAGPNVLHQTKNYFSYCACPKLFVPEQRLFVFNKFSFSAGTKSFGEALNAIQFLV
jgi:hypothetical protein